MKLARVERMNLGLGAGAVAASFALAPPHFAIGVALGALLEAINFASLYRAAERFFIKDQGAVGTWMLSFVVRLTLLTIALVVLVELGINAVALVIGLSLAVPAVLIDAWFHRPEIVAPELLPALDPNDEAWDHFSVWQVGDRPHTDEEVAPAEGATPGPNETVEK